MRIKHLTFYTIIILLILILGSAAGVYARKTRVPEYIEKSENNVTVSVRTLDRKMLMSLYGSRNNPFFQYRYAPLDIVEVSIESASSTQLLSNTVELKFNGTNRSPLSRTQVTAYWERELEPKRVPSGYGKGRFDGWKLHTVEKRLDEAMLPKAIFADSQSKIKGFLLFEGKRNERGEATLSIPVYDKYSELIHEFTFSFEL